MKYNYYFNLYNESYSTVKLGYNELLETGHFCL
jgi:hypothetical protein